MLWYLSANIFYSEKRTVFRKRSSSFKEQKMSKDKYANIFSRQMEATRVVLKIWEYHSDANFPVLAG